VFYSLVSWYAVITQSRGGAAAAAGLDLLLYQVVTVITNLGSAPVIKRMRDQRAIGFICGACLLPGAIGLYCAAPFNVLLEITVQGPDRHIAGAGQLVERQRFGEARVDHRQYPVEAFRLVDDRQSGSSIPERGRRRQGLAFLLRQGAHPRRPIRVD
jgi:hypothetical protein